VIEKVKQVEKAEWKKSVNNTKGYNNYFTVWRIMH